MVAAAYLRVAVMDARAKILVVDDNEQNRALARDTLEDEFDVVEANDGEAGIAAFTKHSPDCVLMDVRMPHVDGFAAAARIRVLPNGAATPIIFVTALRDIDTFDEALRSGANDFLTKPFRPTELVTRIKTALQLKKLGADLVEAHDLVRKQRDDVMRMQLLKERLAAFVVHDLKNPVNTLDLHAQLLLRDTSLSADARNAAKHIRQDARALMRLILNLLDISKADEGELTAKKSRVDLDALTAEIVESLEVRANDGEVKIERVVGAKDALADSDLLRRVLENLLENALRHAPPKSTVHIRTSEDERGVEIRVADEGKGVPPSLREKVFDKFVQLESAANATTGRGLGLTFCRSAVEAHSGEIWVEEGKPGAIFCVRLPR